ncbi:oligosaccharide flippase family protein [Phenylobacterium soli]|uniref:Polysaccharide biosynthesis protein C-terminal domain-containing protein n=1 Tax=Phenylobacterium soli TaxID=2170551 RepID=A0A328AMB0_9CAUL|nr:oligosaccharide flippase family protein [Phenylobacterium soli]RAK56092.1 hypothetical protein DJ017_17035 [Phenylobacterium soli]
MARAAFQDVSKLLSGSVIAKLFGVASTMLFARLLTKDQMAIFPVFLMLAGIPNLVLTFGIFSTFMRELPRLFREDEARARGLVMTGSLVVIACTITAAVSAAVFSGEIARLVFRNAAQGWIIQGLAPGFVAYVIAKIGESVVSGRGQFGRISAVQIVDSVFRPLVTIGAFFAFGVKGVVIGIVAAQFLIAAQYLFYMRDILFVAGTPFYPVRALFAESMPYYVGNFLSYLRGDGDTLLVTTFLGPAAVAEYYVAKNLYANVVLIQNAVDWVAVERLARFARTPSFQEKLSELNERIAQLMVPFTLLVVALAPHAIAILAGPRYASSTWPAVVLLFAALAQFIAIPVERAVFVAAPGILRVYFAVFEVLTVLASAALLVPQVGILGVAAARVISPVTGWLFGLVLLKRRFNLVLSLDAVARVLLAGVPVSAVILWLAPRPTGFADAVIGAAVAGAFWVASFAALTLLVNRPMFLAAREIVSHRLKLLG